MNGLGFKPFDLVIPFAVRKGEITGKHCHESHLVLPGLYQLSRTVPGRWFHLSLILGVLNPASLVLAVGDWSKSP